MMQLLTAHVTIKIYKLSRRIRKRCIELINVEQLCGPIKFRKCETLLFVLEDHRQVIEAERDSPKMMFSLRK